jgi:hypothetical protein
MQTTIIAFHAALQIFDVRIWVGEANEHGLRRVRATELLTGAVWFDGEWNVDRLESDDPDATDMEVYLDIEEAVARLVAYEVAA